MSQLAEVYINYDLHDMMSRCDGEETKFKEQVLSQDENREVRRESLGQYVNLLIDEKTANNDEVRKLFIAVTVGICS